MKTQGSLNPNWGDPFRQPTRRRWYMKSKTNLTLEKKDIHIHGMPWQIYVHLFFISNIAIVHKDLSQ